MVNFSKGTPTKFSYQKTATNVNEKANSDDKRISTKDEKKKFSTVLILKALILLAENVALNLDIDTDYLLSSSLLESSLVLHQNSSEETMDELVNTYGWLFELVVNYLQ